MPEMLLSPFTWSRHSKISCPVKKKDRTCIPLKPMNDYLKNKKAEK